MASGLAFFKIVCSSKVLKIPREFMIRVGGSLPKRCLLRDADRNLWIVEAVRRADGLWCFVKGWSEFFTQNSMDLLDVLVLQYKGGNLFDFTLFGHDACEKTRVSPDGQEESDDDEDNEPMKISDDIKVETQENASSGDRNVPSKRSYKKKNVPDSYRGEDIFESGLVQIPDNPYFVTRSRPITRKNELYIPKDVIVDYGLNLPEKLFLVDERGRRWETKVKRWKDGRLWCTHGWRSLCNVNRIGTHDTCVCEFVTGPPMCIRVRVV